jgi:hypothetical protein
MENFERNSLALQFFWLLPKGNPWEVDLACDNTKKENKKHPLWRYICMHR